MNIPWYGYVILAGLAWGTYVPIIFYGGSELGAKSNGRLMAILCVGIAYFVIAVLLPLGMFLTGQEEWPEMKTNGLAFAAAAGMAGAVGAICVIFASKAAMAAGIDAKKLDPAFDPASYRLLIAPIIFGVAPVVNALLSSVWHPKPGNPWHFKLEFPGLMMWVGIALVAVGVFLVLFAKEQAENERKKAADAAKAAVALAGPLK